MSLFTFIEMSLFTFISDASTQTVFWLLCIHRSLSFVCLFSHIQRSLLSVSFHIYRGLFCMSLRRVTHMRIVVRVTHMHMVVRVTHMRMVVQGGVQS